MWVKRSVDIRWLALWTTYMLVGPALACPTECVCKWKNGKRYVECSDKALKSIPNSLDPETQVLDLSENDLQVLQKEIFEKVKLLDLQKIYLHHCGIQKIDNNAFKGLSNLVELDLSNNYLSMIPSPNFVFFPSLMRLSLSNNPVTAIRTHSFKHLSYLNTLELSECKIEIVEVEAFSGLNHLEWLRLNGNALSNIPGGNPFPDTLRGIDLQNNNWNCDCHLRDLHGWLLKFKMPHAVEPICSLPERLRKRPIVSIPEPDLACLPTIIPTTVHIETNASSNVTLECTVNATPEAKVTWLYQGLPLQNRSSMTMDEERNIYFMETGGIDKNSELHIFDIDTEEGGDFACVAENPAGKSQANFTIRVQAKEKPVVIVVTFPQRHLVGIVTVVFLVIVLMIAIIAVFLLKFRTDTRSRKKKESSKEVALNHQTPSSNSSLPKNNGSLILNDHPHALRYTVQCDDILQSNNFKGFFDRNPDLISDAETIANNAQNENTMMSVYKAQITNNDGFEEETTFIAPPMPRQVTWQDQQPVNSVGIPHNIYQHSVDVHLNPGCFLDSDGYPHDYGLPKHALRPPVVSNIPAASPFYSTLPHRRLSNQKLACNYAKDNEFNVVRAPVPVCSNYEVYNGPPNVRRTLQGYPMHHNRPVAYMGNGTVYYNEEFVPSPPEGYKTESVGVCHVAPESCDSWNSKGTCAVIVPMPVPEGPVRCFQIETRCVDTQTNEQRALAEVGDNLKKIPQVSNAKCVSDICSESPDEGYVGDANDI